MQDEYDDDNKKEDENEEEEEYEDEYEYEDEDDEDENEEEEEEEDNANNNEEKGATNEKKRDEKIEPLRPLSVHYSQQKDERSSFNKNFNSFSSHVVDDPSTATTTTTTTNRFSQGYPPPSNPLPPPPPPPLPNMYSSAPHVSAFSPPQYFHYSTPNLMPHFPPMPFAGSSADYGTPSRNEKILFFFFFFLLKKIFYFLVQFKKKKNNKRQIVSSRFHVHPYNNKFFKKVPMFTSACYNLFIFEKKKKKRSRVRK
ncbi:hypothetical protein RFI_09850 [Reticulomyxa filosa]|uniref:Uncharacterized protein n=1 Tax=Reticulomyxa filosa TaxID=46433 RepID=X6NPH7_RETFI|nr:hypothetical protein RFI_09850 [Reticulomyxa filosa]|eukprot:ETO27282.1 hypothetical protein RFI_09850 [Reticulomyxa filosa]